MLYSAALVVQAMFPKALMPRKSKDTAVVTQTPTAVDPFVVAREFVELVRDDPAAAEVWVRPTREFIEIHLITATADAETERRFAEAFGMLIERHHDVSIAPRMHNPRDFASDADVRRAVPSGAVSIPLRD